MENTQPAPGHAETSKPRSGCLRIIGIAALVALVIVIVIAGWVKYNIYASTFTPTELNNREQKVLEQKLALLQKSARQEHAAKKYDSGPLRPEPYSELGARREVSFTEKELNSLVAHDPEVARRVAIDLSDDLLSIKLIVPVEEDILILGGKTLRLHIGIILSYANNKPVVGIKGVSLGGIPLPNAWLGYLKNKNLVEEFGSEDGFWKLFAEGVRDIKVREGRILVRLNE